MVAKPITNQPRMITIARSIYLNYVFRIYHILVSNDGHYYVTVARRYGYPEGECKAALSANAENVNAALEDLYWRQQPRVSPARAASTPPYTSTSLYTCTPA